MTKKYPQSPDDPKKILDSLPKHLKPGDFMGTMQWANEFDRKALEYKDVFLGFVDILGYQNLIKDFGDNSPSEIFEDILHAFSWAKSHNDSLDVTLFSDTLIIKTDDDNPVGFWNIINVIQSFRNQMLEKGYLVRGSVAYGKHFSQKGIWISPCLIKAYKLENEVANVARILIDEDAFIKGTSSIMQRNDKYGIVYDRYFVNIDPTIIRTDFDGCRILSFEPGQIEINYLKYATHPDQKNLNEERVLHCINAGNQALKRLQVGIQTALKRTEDLKSRSKIMYFVNIWNTYLENFKLKDKLKEDYRIEC